MALNGIGSVYGVKEGIVVLTTCIHHHPTPARESDLTVTTSQLVPSALSTAQMLEVLNDFCLCSYTPKQLLMKFHSLS